MTTLLPIGSVNVLPKWFVCPCLLLYAIVGCLTLLAAPSTAGARPPINYDESKVPPYTLPDPLVLADGQRVTDAKTWWERRRPEILKLFQEKVYGKSPGRPEAMKFETRSVVTDALSGKATRKEITVLFNGRQDGPKMNMVLYLPNAAKKPVPVFIGLNFEGNQSVQGDPRINNEQGAVEKHPGKADQSGTAKSRGPWQVELTLSRGYGLAVACYNDICPDYTGGYKKGVQSLFFKPGQTKPEPDEWGSIGAWAWGLSRIMDYLETDPDVDAKHVAVMGHSRLGKTALWAGAQDPRFAIVISNDSGCGGAALSKRIFGETVESINTVFPDWFCGNFKQYSAHEDQLPVDQHELIALIAPRPVYVASAEQDSWADPRGEFLGALGADPVYRLLGADGLPAKEMPAVNKPAVGAIGYHVRSGGHDVTEYDWRQYLDFADRHFKR